MSKVNSKKDVWEHPLVFVSVVVMLIAVSVGAILLYAPWKDQSHQPVTNTHASVISLVLPNNTVMKWCEPCSFVAYYDQGGKEGTTFKSDGPATLVIPPDFGMPGLTRDYFLRFTAVDNQGLRYSSLRYGEGSFTLNGVREATFLLVKSTN